MYHKEPQEHQYSFKNDWFMVPDVDENHTLIKIAHHVDWKNLSERLAPFFCLDNGRRTKPTRAKVSLLIVKHLYKLSDRNVVDLLRRDIYVQYLCDISPKEAKLFINPSTLTKFRKQLGPEGIRIIESEIQKVIQKVKPPRGRRMVTDTTVMPSNIAYPTDVNLLEKVRRKAVEFLDKIKEHGTKRYRTYKRVAKKIVIQYQKASKHTLRSRKKVQKKLIQFCSRNIRQLTEAMEEIKGSLQENSQDLLKQISEFLQTSTAVVEQQKDVYQNKEVKDRIVSLHQPHIRPMVRGKYPVSVEFGPKVLLNLDDHYLYLEDLRFNNASDTRLLAAAIDGYQTRRGSPPTQLAADRGFWSKENNQMAHDRGIKKVAIQNKGKSNHLKDKPFARRLRRLRCKIESRISLAKRKFGLDRCRYYQKHGEEIWARLGLLAMNLKFAMDYG